MDLDRNNQILRVAKMYYMDKIPQNKIAEKESISKPTVSRLIKKAHELGYVNISIEEPDSFMLDLETRIQKKFNLKTVKIFPGSSEDKESLKDLSRCLFNDLNDLVINSTNIGITYNATLAELDLGDNDISLTHKDNIKVIQLNGGLTPIVNKDNSTEFLVNFSDIFDAEAIQICAMAWYSQKKTAKTIKNSLAIERILNYAKTCDIAVYAAETLPNNYQTPIENVLTIQDIENLKKNGTIGFLCGHPINKKGRIADNTFDQHVVAIPLSDIKRIPNKMLVATQTEDAEMVQILSASRFINHLYITENVAKKMEI